jgi:hypothetical protein
MYRSIAALGVVLLSTLASTDTFANPAPTTYHYCEFTPFNPQTRTYFSVAFGTTEIDDTKVKNAFADYVSKKYAETGSAGCPHFNSLAEAESQLKRERTIYSNKTNNRKIIETGWKWAGAESNQGVAPDNAMVSAPRREQSSPGAPASTAAGSSTTKDKSPETLRAEESQDPRLKQMSAEDRQYMLDQGAYAVEYCKDNATLNGLYSCSCFSEKVFDARIKTNGETVQTAGRRERTPFTNLIFRLDIRDCTVPAKIEKYGSDRAREVLKMDASISSSQLDQISACVGSSLAGSFQANPVPNTVVIDGLFNSALVSCRRKALGGGSSAGAPQAGSSQAQPASHPAPHTAVGQPAPAPPPQSPPAQEPRFIAADLTGVYHGKYRCAQGPTNLKLTLVAAGDGSMTGEFTFDLPATSSTRTASYSLSGKYDPATGNFRLNPVKWEPPEPRGFVMVGMDGTFNPNTKQVSGKITSPACSTFEATR